MDNHKILIAEDNAEISDMLRNYLMRAGHTAFQAFDGEQALDLFAKLKPELVLLDIMMPKKDGYEVCETIRARGNVPIIVTSAKSAEEDKERLFDLGADDYVTKPFSFKEVVMRVNAQLRRYYELSQKSPAVKSLGNLTVASDRFEAKANGEILNLSAKEFKILDLLTGEPNRIFPKQMIIDEVWGLDEYIDENTVAVTVARLREKLGRVKIQNVVTVWGLGYKWQD